jgi:lipoprotein-releasing system permease protein
MAKWFLALRYLRKKRIVLLSMAAVALAVALLVVVSSLFIAFIGAVERTGREAFGDIYFNPRTPIVDCPEFLRRLEEIPGVEAAAAVVETYGLLHLGRGDVRAVRVLGIDPAGYAKATSFKQSLLGRKDSAGEPSFGTAGGGSTGGFIGIGVIEGPDFLTDQYDFEKAARFIGSRVVLTAGRTAGSGGGRIRHGHLRFRVADVVFTGIYMRDAKDVYLPIDAVRDLTGDASNEIVQVRLAAGADAGKLTGRIWRLWQDYAREHAIAENIAAGGFITTSKRMQEYFIVELRKQMSVLMLIFGIVCSGAVLLIFCVFYMIVTAKVRDIAIVKSCGCSSLSVASIFMIFGLCVSLAGSAAGTVMGAVVTRNVNAIENCIRVVLGLKLWKSSTYIFEKIPNQVDAGSAAWIVFWVVLAATAGVVFPAVVAARTRPVEILRYE